MAIAVRSILACRRTLAAGFSERRAGSIPMAPLADLPQGIASYVRDGHPHIITRLDPVAIRDLHQEAVAMAWRDGAWDVQVVLSPPIDGHNLGVVDANRQFADASLRKDLIAAAEGGTLIQWTWRPIAAGPSARKGHIHRDTTLQPDGSRVGAPREGIKGLPHKLDIGHIVTIRLGINSDTEKAAIAARHRPRNRSTRDAMTPAQARYLAALWVETKQQGAPPTDLTKRQATALITKITGRA